MFGPQESAEKKSHNEMRLTSAQDKNLGKAVDSQNKIIEGQELPVSVRVHKPTVSLQG